MDPDSDSLNTMEWDRVETVVDLLFSTDYLSKNTQALDTRYHTPHECFKILSHILTHACATYIQTHPSQMTKDDVQRLQYGLSKLGYTFHYCVTPDKVVFIETFGLSADVLSRALPRVLSIPPSYSSFWTHIVFVKCGDGQ